MVTFPQREGPPSHTRNSQRILTVPWDYRIPKIRISTQQADALQVWSSVLWFLILWTPSVLLRRVGNHSPPLSSQTSA